MGISGTQHAWLMEKKGKKKKKSQVEEDINSHDTMCESISKDWLFPWRYFNLGFLETFQKGWYGLFQIVQYLSKIISSSELSSVLS